MNEDTRQQAPSPEPDSETEIDLDELCATSSQLPSEREEGSADPRGDRPPGDPLKCERVQHRGEPGGGTEPVSQAGDAGVFRETLLKWFEGSEYDLSLRQAGRTLERLTAELADRQPKPEPRDQLRGVIVDLIFLVGYLQEEVDVRACSTLQPRDERLAAQAAAVAASLMAQVEALILDLGVERAKLILPSDWEAFAGLRESTLASLDEDDEELGPRGLRTVAELVYRYGLEVQSMQLTGDDSPTVHSLRAAITDLRRLAETTRRTAHRLPAPFSGPLATLTRSLLAAAAELTHAVDTADGREEAAH